MSPIILDATDTIRRSRRDELVDLASDLSATAIDGTNQVDALAIHHRPTLLRRVAAQLAGLLTPGVDRILATTVDTPLATAVSLRSGIPFVTVDSGQSQGTGTVIRGELHPSEDVAIIATTTLEDAENLQHELAARQVGIVGIFTAIALLGDGSRSIYQLTADGLVPSRE